ncbi:MAG: roadblock/LC7 domain-containing protein [Pseudomonadota bacterium]
MVKKKKHIHDAVETVMIDGVPITPFEEDPTFTALRTSLAEINKAPGVTGYILRNTTSAAIDLKNQEKLTNYAILSAQSIETGQELSELFDLGKVEHVLIEGKNHKIICMAIGENKVSIFMEKNADHTAIIGLLSP